MSRKELTVNSLQFIEARASEIASLMRDVERKGTSQLQKLPFHMRRRAASSDPKRVPRKLQAVCSAQIKASKKNRKSKSKPKNIREEYASRSRANSTWLETHIWHAKRFKMDTLFGYKLPIHPHDRKLGAAHRSGIFHCMAQDLSYYCCIQLQGLQEELLNKLLLLSPESTGLTFSAQSFLDGTREGKTFLYHPRKIPFKAIGPISFMWQPLSAAELTTRRKIWIWCHPSFHDELVSVLIDIFKLNEHSCQKADEKEHNFTCKVNFDKMKKHFNKEKQYFADGIRMSLLKNTLVRHRLIGPKSQQVLARVLKLANVDGDLKLIDNTRVSKRFKLDEQSDGKDKAESDEKEDQFEEAFWWESFYANETRRNLHSRCGTLLHCLQNIQTVNCVPMNCVFGFTVQDPRMHLGWSREIVDSNDDVCEVREKFKDLLIPEMSDSPLWDETIRHEATSTKMSENEMNKQRSLHVGKPDFGRYENRIPIIIVNRHTKCGHGSGWDLIAPQGWSMDFWRSYERKGARAYGLRDINFVNLESGNPNFPNSFPDTQSGTTYEEKVRTDSLTRYYKRPYKIRPNFPHYGIKAPFFMCWKTLVDDWSKELEKVSLLFETTNEISAAAIQTVREGDFIDGNDFYVIRSNFVTILMSFFIDLKKKTKRRKLESSLDSFKITYDKFVVSALASVTDFQKSLVTVRLHDTKGGCSTMHSYIYLPNESDIAFLKDHKQNFTLVEPNHKTGTLEKNVKKDFDRPKVETLISNFTRIVIGYVSEGCYTSLYGRSMGVGHCSFIGFIYLLKFCIENEVQPFVLFREQHSFQYRFAEIEPVENRGIF